MEAKDASEMLKDLPDGSEFVSGSPRSCRRCVHGSPYDESGKLLCIAKSVHLHINNCCAGFRQITGDERIERCKAQFSEPCLPIFEPNDTSE